MDNILSKNIKKTQFSLRSNKAQGLANFGCFRDNKFQGLANFGCFRDNKAQGSVELILLIGGILVIILVVVSMYKSYLIDLGTEIDSNEIKTLNSSFNVISSKFE